MQVTYRRLPHFYAVGQPQFVTFRLHDSLPRGRYFDEDSITSGQAFAQMDRLLDRGVVGPRFLRMPNIAQLVADSIRQGESTDYALHAWVVMPNHVHMLITPRIDVSALMRKLKGGTARRANLELGRLGKPFWQHESYDRLVRDGSEFRKIERYIVHNPVRAGLVFCAEGYRWSSAWSAEVVG